MSGERLFLIGKVRRAKVVSALANRSERSSSASPPNVLEGHAGQLRDYDRSASVAAIRRVPPGRRVQRPRQVLVGRPAARPSDSGRPSPRNLRPHLFQIMNSLRDEDRPSTHRGGHLAEESAR